MEATLTKLLDFNTPFDVPLLEQVVTCANNPSDPNLFAANNVLMQLQQCPDMW